MSFVEGTDNINWDSESCSDEDLGRSAASAAATTSHRCHHIATGSSFRQNLVRHRTRSCSTFNSHIWLIVTAQMEAAFNLPFKNLPQVLLLPLWVISLLQLPRGLAKNHYYRIPDSSETELLLCYYFCINNQKPTDLPRLLSLSRLVLEEKPEPIKPEKTLQKHKCF